MNMNPPTRMTRDGISTTAPGQEQYEIFNTKLRGKSVSRVMYDYRTADGELFSTVDTSLEACRAKRDKWLASRS